MSKQIFKIHLIFRGCLEGTWDKPTPLSSFCSFSYPLTSLIIFPLLRPPLLISKLKVFYPHLFLLQTHNFNDLCRFRNLCYIFNDDSLFLSSQKRSKRGGEVSFVLLLLWNLLLSFFLVYHFFLNNRFRCFCLLQKNCSDVSIILF